MSRFIPLSSLDLKTQRMVNFEASTFQIVTAVPITILDITPVPREVRVVDTKARLAWRLKPRDFAAQ